MDFSPASVRPRLTRLALPAVMVLTLWGSVCGCSVNKPVEAQQSSSAPKAVPVRTALVQEQAAPVTLQAIGTVEPLQTVEVKSMVAGQLEKVHFEEGQIVEAGQVLFTIDRSPFEAALRQLEAAEARNQAQLENARVQAQRVERLVQEGIGQQQELDQARTSAAVLEAAVQADRAAVERAKVDLGYTVIRAPLAGRTGNLMVDEGNLVKANDVALVTINQIAPVYVSFTVPDRDLPQIRQYMAACTLAAQAQPSGDTGEPVAGTLTFVNNEVDRETGTVQLKATFPNEDERLWPGQFAEINLTLTTRPNVVVVPSEAVQAGQGGQFVFVVKDDQTVEPRPIVTSDTIGDAMVVEKGLQTGETVVTEGHLRLAPGMKVTQATALAADGATKS